MSIKQQAESYLKLALDDPSAFFHDGQWESISELLDGNRALVIQRTGWGKSMVYFLTTKLLREKGSGPTLLISPLLSLMRNQLEAAERIGLTARTINGTNTEYWEHIETELKKDQVDILLISPERLANDRFRQNVLASLTNNIGLFVIDEAHCISDWGHDFRPDYRRIVRVLQLMPSNVPVLATTATANDRVVEDIETQLGHDLVLLRGSLVRKSLKLQNIVIPSQAARMAWLAEVIPTLSGSGIVYTLTQRDADRVSEWLQINDITAEAYHSDVIDRERLEQKLLGNKIKVLVATVALGMGFDKPDLGFVIHFQRPSSVVHYYQQVGRAGRAVDEAYGVLLCGEEDDMIANFFINNAFPPQQHILDILEALDKSDSGLSVPELQRVLNLKKSQIEKTIKFLTIESPSPIQKMKSKWLATAAAVNYQIDQANIDGIKDIRKAEQQQMRTYMHSPDCLMAFLQSALDDPLSTNCGQCRNCAPELLLKESYNEDIANRAGIFLKQNYQPILPRKKWPASNLFTISPLAGSNIHANQLAEEGRALSLWRDSGWGQLVANGKYQTHRFEDELVIACVEMLKKWAPNPAPKWITCIPSFNQPTLLADFSSRLADALDLPFVPCIEKSSSNIQQKQMQNSYQQAKNLDGAFTINDACLTGECLLIDDMVDSRWTFTVASALLRQAGCTAVYPMALALNSPRAD
ncbi:RecQ family ATP-dependent DNA helicase [Psychrobacter sp. GP33]|uniref:RecQ family ATP-dependent DNA helicase n=1 Tax=Psychrobacter sp. GP33 TaxID=2758709 RepID=UPI0015FA1405|nr:RecQ family ATP-dependent DNA helicase [Psychrobacter sp. GP33]